MEIMYSKRLLWHTRGKESACQYRRCKRAWVRKIPAVRKYPSGVWPGKFYTAEESGRLWSRGLQRIGHN